jgi:two-component system, LytTR family, response regulator
VELMTVPTVRSSITESPSASPDSIKPHYRRIVIKSGGRIVILNEEEIDWIQASANYVRLFTCGECYVLRQSIGSMSVKLDSSIFARIHRSIIVNTLRIRELHACNSGEYMVILNNGRELSCSRTYRSNLQMLIGTPIAGKQSYFCDRR